MDTFRVTIGGDEYEVDADNIEEARLKATDAAGLPSMKPELGGITGALNAPRDWIAGLLSDSRIAKQERGELRKEGVSLAPDWEDMIKAGMTGAGAAMAPAMIAHPLSTLLAMAPAYLGGKLTGAIGEAAGESEVPGLGEDITGPAAEFVGGAAAGAVPSAATKLVAGVFPKLAGQLEKLGIRQFADLIPGPGKVQGGSRTKNEQDALEERLDLIKDKLPWLWPLGSRAKLLKTARKELKPAGEAVSEVYRKDTSAPRGLNPVTDRFEKDATKNVMVPQHETGVYDEAGTLIDYDTVPTTFKDDELAAALSKRYAKVKQVQERHMTNKGDVTLEDLLEHRQAADTLARRANPNVHSKAVRELMPKPRVLRSEREALSDYMHELTPMPGPVLPGKKPESMGKRVDDVFAAWKEMERAGKAPDAGTFLARWVFGRAVGGLTGTLGGAAVAKPAFWKSGLGKSEMALADALRRGDRAGFERILTNALIGGVISGPDTEK